MPRYSCHDWEIKRTGKRANAAFLRSVRSLDKVARPLLTNAELLQAAKKNAVQFPGFGLEKPYKIKKVPNYDRNDKQSNEPEKCKNPKCKCVLRIGNKKDFCAPCESRNLKENGLP